MAEKKNQHFVPQFFLKNFSLLGNRKEVGAFLINTSQFINAASIKHQCSRAYFYGKDGKVEDFFSKFEYEVAPLFAKIIKNNSLIKLDFEDLAKLFLFISLLELRNPVFYYQYQSHSTLLNEAINGEMNDNRFIFELPKVTHDETVEAMLKLSGVVYEGLIDLDVKILINKTKYPFICSDFPLVKYNRFLYKKNYKFTKVSNGSVGIQIFLPISPEITICFYDSKFYKIGNKKLNFINLDKDKDIFDLNMLQYLNSTHSVYFNEIINKEYLDRISDFTRKIQKPNLPLIESSYLIQEGKPLSESKDLFVFKKTETNYKADFDYFNFTKFSSKYIFKNNLSQLRSSIEKYINMKTAREGIKSLNIESFYKKK